MQVPKVLCKIESTISIANLKIGTSKKFEVNFTDFESLSTHFEVNVPFVWDEKSEFFRYFQSFQKANIGLKFVGIIVSG